MGFPHAGNPARDSMLLRWQGHNWPGLLTPMPHKLNPRGEAPPKGPEKAPNNQLAAESFDSRRYEKNVGHVPVVAKEFRKKKGLVPRGAQNTSTVHEKIRIYLRL